MKAKKLLAILMALAMVISLAACGSSSSDDTSESADTASGDTETAESDGEVVVGVYGTNYLVNPYDALCSAGINRSNTPQNMLIYEPLLLCDSNGEYSSRILESWEWLDDYTFQITLKDGIYFDNGEQMTGEDVLYSLETIQTGQLPISFMYCLFDPELSYVSDDGLTVTLVSESINPQATTYLEFPIMCKSWMESEGVENIDWTDPSDIVFCGPYECVEYVEDSYAVYVKRDDYWGLDYGYDYDVETFTVRVYTDSTAMIADYVNGIIDVAWGITSDDYDAVLAGDYENTEAGRISNNFVSWLALDLDNEYLSDIAVREAICYAVNVEELTETVMGSLGIAGTGLLATGMLGYTDDFQYEYDPDYALEVLEEAGYSEGDITLLYTYKSSDPNQQATAEMVQAYLMAIGITVELNPMDESTYSTEEAVDGYSDFAYYWMSNGSTDPGQFTGNLTSSANNVVVCRNGLYDDIISEINGTTDTEAREEALYELQQMMYENFDILPLYEYCNGYMYNTEVIESMEVSFFAGDLLNIVLK